MIRILLSLIALVGLMACNQKETQPPFSDIAAASGLDFTHYNGMSGKYYYAEIMGAGAALFDYDNDGDLDVYLIQNNVPEKDRATVQLPPGLAPLRDRLYRNDLTTTADGSPVLKFTDVTDEAGINITSYGMGVTAADYDNDGDIDLYIAGYGPNFLLQNNSDGTFTDVAEAAGVQDLRWGVTATFTDLDNDGHLDLYLANYLDFTFETNRSCFNAVPNYCSPKSYTSTPDALFHNQGDGTFVDVSEKSGLAYAYGASLGVVAADLNSDGLTDLYVANDGQPNFFWINKGDLVFEESALLSGAALNQMGQAEASMGIDAADFDADGDEDIFMTHLTGETNTIYVNNGKGFFEDRTINMGLGSPSQSFTGFGTAWFDYDNDSWLDLLVVNGAVTTIADLVAKNDPYPLHQTNQLFRNIEGQRFEEVTANAGDVFDLSEVSRGAAFGDIDNDGDTDVLVTNNNGPVRLLQNNLGNQKPWLGLILKNGQGRLVTGGARVEIHRQGMPPLLRRVRTESSYACSNDPRILVGLGEHPKIERITVYWPDGQTEQWSDIQAGQWQTLTQGAGQAVQ